MEIAVVEAHGVPPVVDVGGGGEAVARRPRGEFVVVRRLSREREMFAGVVEEIILRGPVHAAVVGLPEIDILPRHVVGDEVDDDLQAGGVRPCNQRLEVRHRPEIRRHGVVIPDGVRRAGRPLDTGCRSILVTRQARGVVDHPRVPDVRHPEAAHISEGRFVEIYEASSLPKSRKHLVNKGFRHPCYLINLRRISSVLSPDFVFNTNVIEFGKKCPSAV